MNSFNKTGATVFPMHAMLPYFTFLRIIKLFLQEYDIIYCYTALCYYKESVNSLNTICLFYILDHLNSLGHLSSLTEDRTEHPQTVSSDVHLNLLNWNIILS